MEQVRAKVYREDRPIRRYGACYERATGEPVVVAQGERASAIAKEKAEKAVQECEWEKLDPTRGDQVIDVGYGWIDEPIPD